MELPGLKFGTLDALKSVRLKINTLPVPVGGAVLKVMVEPEMA